MARVSFEFKKGDFVWIGLIVVLLCVGFGVAYNSGADPSVMGHSADEIDFGGYVIDSHVGTTPDPLRGNPAYLLLTKESSSGKFIGKIFGYRGGSTSTSRTLNMEVAIDLSSNYDDIARVGMVIGNNPTLVNLVSLTYNSEIWYAVEFLDNNFAGMSVGIEGYYKETDPNKLTFKRVADVSDIVRVSG